MKVVHVAVAVIENSSGDFLIARRPEHLHMGGYWEFPGGKVEAGETVFQALQREICEEVALDIHAAQPLLKIPFVYPDKKVLLDVWRVTQFSGEARACENQTLCWVAHQHLQDYAFPPANRAILTALQLPERVLITGEFEHVDDCLQRTACAIERADIRAVMLRAHHLQQKDFVQLAAAMTQLCRACDAQLLLNAAPDFALGEADGLHLSSQRLLACSTRPIAANKWLGASCHNTQDIQQAIRIGADYITLSPVLPTSSHPHQSPLGWAGLQPLLAQCSLPVFALGGLGDAHLPQVRALGVYGIAAISAWW